MSWPYYVLAGVVALAGLTLFGIAVGKGLAALDIEQPEFEPSPAPEPWPEFDALVVKHRQIRAADCTLEGLGDWEHDLLDADDSYWRAVMAAREVVGAWRDERAAELP